MIALGSILTPTDFSEASLSATKYALEFAKAFDATLHLLHVIQMPVIFAPAGGYVADPKEFESYAQTALENWISPEDIGPVQIERRWVHGHPFVEILRDAKQHDIDLIVMGTHGRGAIKHMLLGSVAEKVVRKAPCPVLVVRPTGHQLVMP